MGHADRHGFCPRRRDRRVTLTQSDPRSLAGAALASATGATLCVLERLPLRVFLNATSVRTRVFSRRRVRGFAASHFRAPWSLHADQVLFSQRNFPLCSLALFAHPARTIPPKIL